ncbi:MAG: patatin-like phospholipase family protein [Dehalococcoidales bacterium]|nr:patatin-like phospholipase family protein [Dehalococcoidales bacterium]
MKRAVSPKKVGLALGSGAARGLSHIGVLKALEQEGIPIDMIAGTSTGALVGALYAQGKDTSQITEIAQELGSKKFSFLVDPTLPRTGLLRGRRVESNLKDVFGDTEFSDLEMPFACVATDIESGEEVVINEGRLREGLRATTSLPVLFSLVKREGRYLVDGALVNPVPASILKGMGAELIIAVNVLLYKSAPRVRAHNIFSVIMQTIHISSYRLVRPSLEGADVVIQPLMEHIAFADFHRVQECIEQGERAAQEMIPEIKERISAS